MTAGALSPDLDRFRELAGQYPIVPVTRRVLADGETPVGTFRKLAGGPGTFLLESADGGVWSRYSFVGVRSAAVVTERDGRAVWVGEPPPGVRTTGPVMAVLQEAARLLRGPRLDDAPPLLGGLVGYLSYDSVRHFERLPELAADDLHHPQTAFMLATDLAVLDHSDGTVLLVANVVPGTDPDAAFAAGVARLDEMASALAQPAPSTVATFDVAAEPDATSRTARSDYLAGVERIKEEIRAGEAFQVVYSQRFELPCRADPLDVYRVLRASNPSPYMYLLRFADLDVVGSSPEALVKLEGDRATMHPIAGSRWRGSDPAEDARLAAEMLADPKERSEHVMLVDLGRNDLGRVCVPGSVDVVDFMSVERYSHVMHIVSTVVGTVRPDRGAFDVLAACFPAGTLSGAPKPRAMEIIEELEPTRRGLYGGAVGYLAFAGDMDTAIAIRTAVIRDGVAVVQAGAGIVADSDPVAEEQESRNKAAAVLRAVAVAETLRPVGEAAVIATSPAAAPAAGRSLAPTPAQSPAPAADPPVAPAVASVAAPAAAGP